MTARGIAVLVAWLAAALCASAGDGKVTGVATYRERIALPPGAVFEAVLSDVSRADADAVELGRAVTADPGAPPYSFAIPYDPAAIDPRHSYAVRAQITSDGRLRFTSESAYPVITDGAPLHVEIDMTMVRAPGGRGLGAVPKVVQVAGEGDVGHPPTLRGFVTYMADAARFTDCRTGESHPIAMEGDYQALEHAYLAAGQDPGAPVMASFEGRIVERPRVEGEGTEATVLVDRFVGVWPGEGCGPGTGEAALTDTYWKIVRLGELELTAGLGRREPHMVLRGSDGRFQATVGCNEIVGGFEVDGDRLRFGQGAATRMACLPPLDGWERQLALTMGETAAFHIDGQVLELLSADDAAIATFRAVYLP